MKVTVYSSTTCPNCVVLKERLKALNISFEERNIDLNIDAKVELFMLNYCTVPLLVVDDKIIEDYNKWLEIRTLNE